MGSAGDCRLTMVNFMAHGYLRVNCLHQSLQRIPTIKADSLDYKYKDLFYFFLFSHSMALLFKDTKKR